jgi:hypothetical protein
VSGPNIPTRASSGARPRRWGRNAIPIHLLDLDHQPYLPILSHIRPYDRPHPPPPSPPLPSRDLEYFHSRSHVRVIRLNVEIENVKEAQRGRYCANSENNTVIKKVRTNMANLESSSSSSSSSSSTDRGAHHHPSSNRAVGGDIIDSCTPLADNQRAELQRLHDVDAIEIDADLDEIHDGIKMLHELALRQGEEVRRHGNMLDVVDGRVDRSLMRTNKATSRVERFGRRV